MEDWEKEALAGLKDWEKVMNDYGKEAREQFEKEELHYASSKGDLKRVKELVAEGHDVNAFETDLAWTPLHHAAMKGQIGVMKYLLSAGADVNANDDDRIGETPLGAVAQNCSYQVAEFLVKAGADPTIEGWVGLTALDRASERKKPEGRRVYELLLEASKKKMPW